MKNKIKIVIFGAGGKEFTSGLLNDLALDKALRRIQVEVILVDIDTGALERMYKFAQLVMKYTKAEHLNISRSVNGREALANANFVIISVAVKRMELWEQDFRVALSFGFKHVFGENGGPAALFHALRNYKIIMPICRDIEEICPDAIVLNFTNPEARILTAVLKLTKLKAYGLCHGFHSICGTVSRLLKRDISELDIRSAGMNHLYTYYHISDKKSGENLIKSFEAAVENNISSFDPLTQYLYEKFGVLGYASEDHTGEYVAWAHEFMPPRWLFGIENHVVLRDRNTNSQDAYNAWGKGLAGNMKKYFDESFDTLNDDYLTGKRPLDDDFVKISGEIAVPVIGDIVFDTKKWRPSVNVLNTQGYISNLSFDGCIEVPAIVDAQGVHPEYIGELPEAFAALIRLQHSIQKLLVEAYSEKSKKKLLQALLIDPLTHSAEAAEKYVDYMLKLQEDYLPELN